MASLSNSEGQRKKLTTSPTTAMRTAVAMGGREKLGLDRERGEAERLQRVCAFTDVPIITFISVNRSHSHERAGNVG